MLIVSISRTDAAPSPTGHGLAQDLTGTAAHAARAESVFESRTPLIGRLIEGHGQGAGDDRAAGRSDADLVDAEDDLVAVLAREPGSRGAASE